MKNRSMLLLAAGLIGLGGAVAAQPGEEAPASANILPPDMERSERFELMKHFAQSLGVRCTYCHVGEEGEPLSTYDFASEAKPAKRRARAMLRLTDMLNRQDDLPGEPRASMTDMSENRVTCYTCHRGQLTPATQPPAPDPS